MDMSFYTCAVGAHQQQRRLDVHANNIANVNNYGFRARVPSFSVLMTNQMEGIQEDLRRGAGARLEAAEPRFEMGQFLGTERALDYAINGRGFFAVMDPLTNEVAYTREGSFNLMNMRGMEYPEPTEEEAELGITPEPVEVQNWFLSDGDGRYVLGRDGRPVQVSDPMAARYVGDPLPVGIFDFVNYDGMDSEGLSGLKALDKNGQPFNSDAQLVQGYLEISNTDFANEMTRVIESQRSFQYMIRMIQTSDEITTTVNSLR